MKNGITFRFLNTLIIGLVTFSASGQEKQAQQRPRLVVGIVVDQIRTDYLDYLKSMFGENGFRLLMDNGAYFKDLDFKIDNADIASGTAMIATGAYPAANGIPAANVIDRQTKRLMPSLLDGNTLSPARLRLSTIADEIAVDGIGLGAIHSIAADPQQAVLLAGHAGGSAVWIDEKSPSWTSSSYFGQLPQPAASRNRGKLSLSARIDTMHWTPSRPLADYPGIPAQKKYYDFRYTFPSSDKNSLERFAISPLANREVTALAADYIRSPSLGKRGDVIDMLSIGYSLGPVPYIKDGDCRLELEDAYLRLDSDLSRLFSTIESSVGLDNTLIYLLPTGHFDDTAIPDPKYRIPTGEFSAMRAGSLLNSYLCAKYGAADYVDFFDGTHLYLGADAIRAASSPAEMIAADAASFLSRMSGVRSARTISEIISSDDPELRAKALSYDPSSAPDIIVEVMPGWVLNIDTTYPQVKKPVRINAVSYPGFILSPAVERKVIGTPTEAVAITPTISQILRIRGPNGASARPIPSI